jgi:DNA repair exonuclease SbcCD ATPase subunit
MHDELRDYAEFVTLDGIVERRSRDLHERKAALESQLATLARRSEEVEATLGHFTELDRAREAYAQQATETTRLAAEGKATARKRDDANRRFGELNRELEAVRKAGAVRRMFLRSETAISTDILGAKRAIAVADAEAVRLVDLYREVKGKKDTLSARGDALAQALASVDRADLIKQIEALNGKRQPLLNELAAVNKAVADIEAP